ncbi:MAG TPA: photosystem II stability/assembly factor-like protein, partial [Cytophagales bacterium]|nr:photosystem II stability/assembly factor-like protein [Cytophagales bacterium]
DAGHTWQRYDGAGFHTLEATPSGNVLWASGPAGRIGRLVLGE